MYFPDIPRQDGRYELISWWIGYLTIPGPSSVLFGCVFVSLLFTAHLINCAQLIKTGIIEGTHL